MSNPAPEDSIPSTPVPPPENVLGTTGEGDVLSTPAPPENVFSTPGEDNVSSTPAPPENILDAPGEDNVLAAPAPPDNVFSTPEDNITSTLAPPENIFATPVQDNVPLQPPTPLTDLTPLETSPRDSFTPSAAPLVPENEKGLDEEGLDGRGLVVGGLAGGVLAGGSLDEKGLDETGLEENVVDKPEPRRSLFKRPIFWFVAAALIAAVVLAVILPVYFTVIRPKNNTSTGGGNPNPDGGDDGGNDSGTPTPPSNGLTTGGDGSTITMENGTEFTYRNPFGGFWVWDPANPFSDNAQPNSWTPPLNTTWRWGVDKLYGVNLGGWFVLEPFITPDLYQRYAAAGAIDEWTLSTLMAADEANGGIGQLERHYDTFISEQDFAEIAGAGLNWVRLPVPWWAIDVWGDEPFLPRTSWRYILRAFQWARKYGLRLALDLHTAPGSQNAFNHSGRKGVRNFLSGPMGLANAQRMINYIRIFTEFISQPEYANVVPMFCIINEAVVALGTDTLTSFNLEVYRMMREITGTGEGNGPYIAISNGLTNIDIWAGLLPNADRVALDTHPYFAFNGEPNTAPVNVLASDGQMGGTWSERACTAWKEQMNTIQTSFGVTFAGEYSNAINDCGTYLRSVEPYTPANPDCDTWNDWQNWDQATKDGILSFALASMDALENPFFWTWKIGNTQNGGVESPLWSYKLGLDNGWMPADPRSSVGKCQGLGVTLTDPFDGSYLPWQTGGPGAGDIPASVSASYPWPPASIVSASGAVSLLPQYTPTGSITTLPPPTATPTNVQIDGWHDSDDTTPAPTPISGCTYPDAWAASYDITLPIAGCSPAA